MARIAEVFINLPIKNIARAFSYIIPESLSRVGAGWRVIVPFGGRKTEGFVVCVAQSGVQDSEMDLKEIIDVIDEQPWFSDHMMAVAYWLSTYYFCTPAEAMRLFIPGKTGIKTAKRYSAAENPEADAIFGKRPAELRQLYDELRSAGHLTINQITARFGNNGNALIRQLLASGLATSQSVTRKTAQHQYKTYWQLNISNEQALEAQNNLRRKPAQILVIQELLARGTLAPEELKQLKISNATLNKMVADGLLSTGRIKQIRDSYADYRTNQESLNLSDHQREALVEIGNAIALKIYQSFLLFGVTGSGKTQVYIEAAAKTRELGRQVVVLVPEIALTGQIVNRFKRRFGEDVVVLHSKLSVGERFDTWQRLRQGDAGIVIGARSAVFAPVPDPGLFIIDEEHEFTYKQEESPHYHTRLVAAKRAEISGSALILGSATPSVETYYDTLQAKHRLLAMPQRIDDVPLPEVAVVDMREELKAGNRSVISEKLRELLNNTLQQGEQAIVLLNRRGYSTFVICRECGYVMRCPHCAVSLVYHSTGGTLRCHYCQAKEKVPDVCPACSSRYIRYFGTGTQKVEEELSSLFPQARIVRMDQDTTGGKMAHDRILNDFSVNKYDILLGTQMVAKGHDIKNVTAVGIISADTALNLPDFRAAERTFALLTQAAGRAGRGDKTGRVVVQTYNPEHYAVQAGASHDYEAFYRHEIEFRRELNYPPYSRLIKMTIQGNDESKTRGSAEQICLELARRLEGTGEVVGPFAAPVARINDQYRIHILVKTLDIARVNAALVDMEVNVRPDVLVDVDPLNVL